MTIEEAMKELSKPFHPSDISYKPQAVAKDGAKAMAITYADPRAYMNRLDAVCGGEWSVTYTPWGDRIVCHLTVAGVTRSSTGEGDSQSERSEIAGTAAEAQAFKRACVMFGLGRYLYDLHLPWVEFDSQRKQFTEQGKAKLEKIVVEHYRRAMGTTDYLKASPEPQHRNIANAEELLAVVDETQERAPAPEENPFNTPSQPVAQVSKGFAWPTGGDSLEACAHLINYDIPMSEGARKLTLTMQDKHKASKGKGLSDKQYKYLVGLVDKVTGDGSHRAVLSVVCGAQIGEGAFPGWQCKELIDWLVAKNTATVDAIKGVGDAIKNLVAA